MEIKAHSKNYEVIFKENFDFIEKIAWIEQSLWVIDKNVFELYEDIFNLYIDKDRLMLIEATESNKIIETALNICERMTLLQGKRNSTLISVGGGITQDITGFAANILYRGVQWIFIPTTLLAACDSCIGSKTSLNFKEYKNLLGTFYPPDELYICLPFFKTLSEIDLLSGLGEVVKFNIMSGRDSLSLIENDIVLLLQRDEQITKQYIHKSLEFKKTFIEADEFDRGIRIKLNFAHTFGHAFETATNYAIPHGTAVAMGTIVASSISCSRGFISKETNKKIQSILLKIIDIQLLKENNNLNIQDIYKFDSIMRAISKDKKQISSSLTAILFENEKLGLAIFHDLNFDEIKSAIKELMNIL